MSEYKVLFGPIVSRRLGLSLGVNLIPKKTCNLNCIYCEVGHTTHFVRERKEYFSTQSIIKEVEHFLSHYPSPENIKAFTFSGAGEPTLASNLGEVVRYLKSLKLNAEIVIITNSLLFKDPEVFDELLLSDRVMPSLDAATQLLFQKIDRGVPELRIEEIISSMEQFRKQYKGQINLEIFLANEKQLDPEEIIAYKQAINRIKPDSIDINTLDRPGAIEGIKPMPQEMVERFKQLLGYKEAERVESQKVDASAKSHVYDMEKEESVALVTESILRVLRIRPSTLEHLIIGLGIHKSNIIHAINLLMNNGAIKVLEQQEEQFYCISR